MTVGDQAKETARAEGPSTSHLYDPPRLTVLGTLAGLTRENFQNLNADFNFSGVELTGAS